jgi:uncharacterized protein
VDAILKRVFTTGLPLAILLLMSSGNGSSTIMSNIELSGPVYQKTNHLKGTLSPYLLQHQYNPVDWYPWGEEAFERAKNEDKPIFLSIGYSTCHWCHVMEHESFENQDIADLLNEYFICVKVDREERPDIDGVYMKVCQLMTGSGGWPLTILMTPDKKPFFAGTYIPPDDRYKRMGMRKLIPRVNELWNTERSKLLDSAQDISSQLIKSNKIAAASELPDERTIAAAVDILASRYDPVHGGFGQAPKFPTPHNYLLVLRQWSRDKDPEKLALVQQSLLKMWRGGVFDQIGFGFHRYSTDEQWLVPHFEKMLYDQAMMLLALSECYEASISQTDADEDESTALIAADLKNCIYQLIEYVRRDLAAKDGGFYSAEDADSEGEEGLFYVWTLSELQKILDKSEFELARGFWNLKATGNWSEGRSRASNIPHLKQSLEEFARENNQNPAELAKEIDSIRIKIFKSRENRIRPGLDDKILTDWNGLMIGALARCARVFNDNDLLKTATGSANFILKNLQKKDGRLLHRLRGETAGIRANLDDYAFMIFALLELAEASAFVSQIESLVPQEQEKNFTWIEKAAALQVIQNEYFWDETSASYFFSPGDGEKLLVRLRESYDGAIPSGASMSLLNLDRLSRLTSVSGFADLASRMAPALAGNGVERGGQSMYLCALDNLVGPSAELLIIGDSQNAAADLLKQAGNARYLPRLVRLAASKKQPASLPEYLRSQLKHSAAGTAWFCQNHSCSVPQTTVKGLNAILDSYQAKEKKSADLSE